MDSISLIMVKTDKCCFITDCEHTDGYYYNYHTSKIPKLVFDGNAAKPTFCQNWYEIPSYPEIIEEKIENERINVRYEIKNEDNITATLPKTILYDNKDNYDCDAIETLYEFRYDIAPARLEKINFEIRVLCEVENFEYAPMFDYDAVHKVNYSYTKYKISNVDISHSMVDKIFLPPVLLSNSPCKLSSTQVYNIIRQHIKDHIDTKVAKITSDYDFCFSVDKVIPLIEPKTIAYNDLFAKKKKDREKLKFVTHSYKNVKIFEMTHEGDKYKGYTVINGIVAENEFELKEKLDNMLESLINLINKPLELCKECNGTGYIDIKDI